ncbi:hypothetical protein GP486_004857 [Trichoglossum hirsutum]|uniref:Uncharacterized protein n=1 Tax=Trichoglossum hirsutum TaxID=265104 RepID=A0A9P8LAD7_9PEZI|nr:hypothetical protein GP486_004857 [Trichoglossum hirsutum]
MAIAAVVTPSTLSIQANLMSLHQKSHIPKLDYTTAALLALENPPVGNPRSAQSFSGQTFGLTDQYNGPSPSLSRLAMMVLLTGDILIDVGTQQGGGVCQVYNASYNVSFDFTSEQQVVKVISLELQRSTPLLDPKNTGNPQVSNYRAFMEAFTDVILGVVSHKAYPLSYTIDSSVLQTELSGGPDLHRIFGNRTPSRPDLTLKAGIVGLWQNNTLSLFSSEVAADLSV